MSCLRPDWRTGRQSSRDSCLLSWSWSRRMPKYCRRGDVCPAVAGTCWNLWIVCGVRRMPLGALAATLAASLYCPPWKRVLNLRTNRSSAPGRLLREAMRRARSGLDRELVMY
ncbi:hypothetical protein NP493_303g02002 [Ridgeia piscesae]|uniref:Uncharacterized protein n=1 Tax=Ridgeia piscesae TaxID=27915 RepID=A0AAD9L7G1_RIDPI|nr:hypothetical protein NP493_303g02002 [Ridgeia piscesae]